MKKSEDVMTIFVIFILAMCFLGVNLITKKPMASEKLPDGNHVSKETKRELSGNKATRW